MPINESRRAQARERWPLQFDLEGIPRDTQTRTRLLDELRESPNPDVLETDAMDVPKVKNTFAGEAEAIIDGLPAEVKTKLLQALISDQQKNPGGREFDLSKPPVEPYVMREYPKCMYSPDGKKIINARNKEHEAELARQKFTTKPPKASAGKDDEDAA